MSANKPPFWTSTSTTANRLAGTWENLLATRGSKSEDVDPVPAYDRGASYAVGSVLDHGTFGVGVVVALPARGKVSVRFADSDTGCWSASPVARRPISRSWV